MVIVNGKFLTQRVTGVQRVARELLAALDGLIEKDEVLLAVPPETEELPAYKNIKILRTGRLHGNLWEQLSLPLVRRKYRATLLNLCNSAPLLCPGVTCLHDAKIRSRPGDFGLVFRTWYRLMTWNSGRRCKMLLTVSEFSKSEIVKYQP